MWVIRSVFKSCLLTSWMYDLGNFKSLWTWLIMTRLTICQGDPDVYASPSVVPSYFTILPDQQAWLEVTEWSDRLFWSWVTKDFGIIQGSLITHSGPGSGKGMSWMMLWGYSWAEELTHDMTWHDISHQLSPEAEPLAQGQLSNMIQVADQLDFNLMSPRTMYLTSSWSLKVVEEANYFNLLDSKIIYYKATNN